MSRVNTLKVIAETLNQSNDLREVLQSVLEKLLEVTGLSTGWIFLIDDEPIYSFVADVNLPPALSWGDKEPMCQGSCWCLEKIWDGRLQKAVNIINCKRIEDAIEHDWGDTKAITHHATVPLIAGGEKFGVLNIAAPEKNEFTEEELDLLQSVAFQIGTAIKRTRLYEAQQERAEQYSKLDEISRAIWKMNDIHLLPQYAVDMIGRVFQLESLSFLIKEENVLALRSIYHGGASKNVHKRYRIEENSSPNDILKCPSFWKDVEQFNLSLDHAFVIPLEIGDEWIGCLVGNDTASHSKSIHPDVLKALGDHLSLVLENARLYERGRELALIEERNRLARDLHDSVNQKLFSLGLTARGLKEYVKGFSDDGTLIESLDEMQSLSKEVVAEMRSMIWQLRPAGLEDGVIVALKKYGESLGLKVIDHIEGVGNIPRLVEETMWRIGQEALNNVHKHARTGRASLHLRRSAERVVFSIQDEGCGFTVVSNGTPTWSFGLSSMKERAEIMGGSLTIESEPDAGTVITVIFPIKKDV
ncbi:GAF domain-containing protein [Alkalihalobacillus sp. AL-G]|uniref:GAF domain-containing sensor histidine kinase n=1 Tax=Alkalihalobacillus sp. AL-G TaxID=2926399 RepID=UPI00272AD691|nr:GAF domain-containing protein [Alkalihalobacillus sp. AL-G]WLD92740.1 GAF domain-containing protein [Alkalihalobacillus sp. AL-G]